MNALNYITFEVNSIKILYIHNQNIFTDSKIITIPRICFALKPVNEFWPIEKNLFLIGLNYKPIGINIKRIKYPSNAVL